MLHFVALNIFFVSLGLILVLFVRVVPRMTEDGSEEAPAATVLDRWIASGIPARLDALANGFLLKTLRRMRIFFLRADHAVASKLRALVEERTDKQKPPTSSPTASHEVSDSPAAAPGVDKGAAEAGPTQQAKRPRLRKAGTAKQKPEQGE